MKKPKRTLLVGIGNVLCADDGVGVRTAEILSRLPLPEDVEVYEAGTALVELARLLEGRERVVVIDAIDAGAPPGAVLRLRPGDIRRRPHAGLSLHQLDLLHALYETHLMGRSPSQVIILAVQVEDVSMGTALSEAVDRSLGPVVEAALRELELPADLLQPGHLEVQAASTAAVHTPLERGSRGTDAKRVPAGGRAGQRAGVIGVENPGIGRTDRVPRPGGCRLFAPGARTATVGPVRVTALLTVIQLDRGDRVRHRHGGPCRLPVVPAILGRIAPATLRPQGQMAAPKRARRGRPPARRHAVQERSVETQKRIVDAALDVFAERGYDGATTREIASRAGVNQPLIAYHFTSKEDLWLSAAQRVFRSFQERLRQHAEEWEGLDPTTALRLQVREFVLHGAEHPAWHGFTLEANKGAGRRLRHLIETCVRPIYEPVSRQMQAAQEAGAMPKGDTAYLFYALVAVGTSVYSQAAEFEALTGRDPYAPEAIRSHAELVDRLLFSGCEPLDGWPADT